VLLRDLSNKSVNLLSKMNTDSQKKQARYVVSKLKKNYPNAHCELHHSNPVELLVATVMSAQCTDVMVNKVNKVFFKKYKLPEGVADLPLSKLEKEINSIGLYKNKAKNIKKLCQILVEKYDGKIPETLAELIELPGVGRKTANVVLGEIYNKPEGVVVDTHVKRLSKRLKLTESENPVVVERDLMEVLPKKHWVQFAHWMIFHGRRRCKAQNPVCSDCDFRRKCDYYENNYKQGNL